MADPKPTLLLHVCCGPCATAAIERLRPRYDLTLFFSNPNLHPPEEHERRLEAARRVASHYGVPLVESADDHDAWLEAVRGHEWEPEGGARCEVCFRVRLEETARETAARGLGAFTTTLSISPHKDLAKIGETGRRAALGRGVTYVHEDLKKRDGFHRSVRLSRGLNLYRQDYCGCEFSLRERSGRRRNKS